MRVSGHRAHELDEDAAASASARSRAAPRRVRSRPRDRVARERKDGRLLPHARREDAQRERRIVGQVLRRGHRDVTVEEADALAEIDRGHGLRAATRRAQPLEQARARARRVARVQVVVLHEPLGRERAVGPVPHRDGERLLLLEAEAIASPRPGVKAIAHAPEKLLGGRDLLRFATDQHTEAHELAPRAQLRVGVAVGDAVTRARAPARPVEVAQAARAALHVGLEQIHRAAEALVARGRLGVEAVDEAAERFLAEEPLVGARDELPERPFVAGEHAQVEQRRRRREVRLRKRHRVGDVQHLMTDGEGRVPERIEERLRERRRVSSVDPARIDDERDVRVAPQRDRAAPEAANGRERQAAALGRGEPCQTRRLGEAGLEARPEKACVRPPEGKPILTGRQPLGEHSPVPLDGVTEEAGLRRRDGESGGRGA